MASLRKSFFVFLLVIVLASALLLVADYHSVQGLQCHMLGLDCEDDNDAECPSLRKRINEINKSFLIGNYVFAQSRVEVSGDFGNNLSKYWVARFFAEKGGYHYAALMGFWGMDSFLQYLPKVSMAHRNKRDQEAFQRVLCTCPPSLRDIHECNYGTAEIFETIRHDTRKALKKYANRRYRKPSDNRTQLLGEFFGPNDWFIYDRCVILGHSSHGFATLPIYDALPTEGSYTIYTTSGRKENMGGMLCDELHKIRDEHILKRNPNVTIRTIDQSADRSIDFGRLVFAPNLLVPSAGSSWALWASLANPGRVVTVRFKQNHHDVSVFPDNFDVRSNVTVLYGPDVNGESKRLLGFDRPEDAATPEGKQKLFDCFRNC